LGLLDVLLSGKILHDDCADSLREVEVSACRMRPSELVPFLSQEVCEDLNTNEELLFLFLEVALSQNLKSLFVCVGLLGQRILIFRWLACNWAKDDLVTRGIFLGDFSVEVFGIVIGRREGKSACELSIPAALIEPDNLFIRVEYTLSSHNIELPIVL
jgi:hypothetical protein